MRKYGFSCFNRQNMLLPEKKKNFKCSDLPARTGRGYFPFQKSQLTVGGGEGKTRGTIRAKQALDWPSIFKVFFKKNQVSFRATLPFHCVLLFGNAYLKIICSQTHLWINILYSLHLFGCNVKRKKRKNIVCCCYFGITSSPK